MALFDFIRRKNTPPTIATWDGVLLNEVVRPVSNQFVRINLLNPRHDVRQRCEYVQIPSGKGHAQSLLAKIYHEGDRVVAVEVSVPADEMGSIANLAD